MSDPLFAAPMSLLVDARQSHTTLSTESIRNWLNHLALKGAFRTRVAHVASDALHQALGRMAEAYAELEGIEFRSFPEFDEARLWLEEATKSD